MRYYMRKECLKSIFKLAQKDKKLLFIGSDLGPGVLSEFKKNYPKRFFMEGVSEQAIIGIAAGLAMEGYNPYVNTIATFLTRRCFEQVYVDLCLHNLSVKLVANGGGLVYAPLGPTHLATDDLSIMRTLPNMKIIAPCDAIEMRILMKQINKLKGPVYVRIAKGGDKIITSNNDKVIFGKARLILKPKDFLILSTGVMAQIALSAAIKINQTTRYNCGVLHFNTIKPLDEVSLIKSISKVKKVLTVEENILIGGFGSAILETVNRLSPENSNKICRVGLQDKFIENYGTQDELLEINKLTENNIINILLK